MKRTKTGLIRLLVCTLVAGGAWTATAGVAAATGVCNGHGGIAYAGADSRGGSVHIICVDGREFDI